ncbi:hypothetical protein PoB_006445600 [Plakobranchus ocellatus]|uniref:Uncharacterized protein n=1 Tax=Plakobranchus ocellatus TaxID=259542 RepID=A0AAV4D1V9_9GAST|nr:hypothetical protein PoB_006445600 [Plakobranchus ocellatus]
MSPATSVLVCRRALKPDITLLWTGYTQKTQPNQREHGREITWLKHNASVFSGYRYRTIVRILFILPVKGLQVPQGQLFNI